MLIKISRVKNKIFMPPLPSTSGSHSLDIRCVNQFYIHPQEIKKIDCGFAVEIPPGYEGQIRPRSGLALRGISVINSPGTIDSDYRGEVCVLLINLSQHVQHFEPGARIAQLVVLGVEKCELSVVDDLSKTERGDSGFGSTGV